MSNHVHVSALSAVIIFCYLIIFGFIWRTLSMRFAESPWGKAMAVIY